MGFGELFTRSTRYTATDTATGVSQTFTIVDGLRPDWSHGPYSGAMSVPGAWRASLLLADLLSAVPWHGYRTRGPDAVAARLTPTPLFLEQPCPPEARVNTLGALALDVIWHGNGVAVIADRDRSGWPTSYVPVRAENVRVARKDRASEQMPGPVGGVCYGIGSTWHAATEIVHVKGHCRPGDLRGMGVLESHLNGALALATEQGRQARSLSTSGVPTGTLKSTDPLLDQSEADELKAGWLKSQRDRTIAVLNATTDFTPLAWDPTETQLLEARAFSLHEIALIFGLDPTWLGVSGTSMTYSNIESQAINLLKFSLGGLLARFEQTLTLHMPRGHEARANLDSILRADTAARYAAHAAGITAGFLTEDEARALENLPPLTPAQRAARRPPTASPASPASVPAGQDPPDEPEPLP